MIRKIAFAAMVAVAVVSSATANAQLHPIYEDDIARYCGERTGQYCWDTQIEGFSSPDACIEAMLPQFCEVKPGEPTHYNPFGANDWAALKYRDLAYRCSGLITCG